MEAVEPPTAICADAFHLAAVGNTPPAIFESVCSFDVSSSVESGAAAVESTLAVIVKNQTSEVESFPVAIVKVVLLKTIPAASNIKVIFNYFNSASAIRLSSILYIFLI